MRGPAVTVFALLATLATSALATLPTPEPGDRYCAHAPNLSVVAQRYHLSVDAIARYNGIKDPAHFKRQGLLLPETATTRELPLYVPWSPAAPRQLCSVQTWTLRPVTEPGCAAAYCGSGPGGERGCLCKEQPHEDGIGGRLQLASPHHPLLKLPLSISSFNPYGASLVDIASVDLDGDGEPETLVSWLDAVSNGLGEEWRTLVVLKGGHEWLRYDSGELTAATAVARVGDACSLASSHYEEAVHPLQGSALYLVERTFDPVTLRADPEIVGRRASGTTRLVLPFDPVATALGRSSIERGRVERVRHAATGGLQSVVFSGNAAQELPAGESWGAVRFGSSATRRVLPIGLASQSLVGRAATLERPPNGEAPVLWLAP